MTHDNLSQHRYTLEVLDGGTSDYIANEDRDYSKMITLLSSTVSSITKFDNLLILEDHMDTNFKGFEGSSNKLQDWVKLHENHKENNSIWMKLKISQEEKQVGNVWIYYCIPLYKNAGLELEPTSWGYLDSNISDQFGKIHQMLTDFEQGNSYEKEIWINP